MPPRPPQKPKVSNKDPRLVMVVAFGASQGKGAA